jgi:hypothetical protein
MVKMVIEKLFVENFGFFINKINNFTIRNNISFEKIYYTNYI